MDYCPGNELYHLLNQVSTLNEQQAKFYIAEIVVALEHMHSLGIVYRDLKPENIMIDLTGHIKIIDFGLSEFIAKKKLKVCGTSGYISPEVVKGEDYDCSSDLYSLGVLLYEMLIGCLPQKFTSSAYLSKSLKFPTHISSSAKNLIQGMMEEDKERRLKVEEIKTHRWLEDIDWEEVGKNRAPYTLSAKSIHTYIKRTGFEYHSEGSTSEDDQ